MEQRLSLITLGVDDLPSTLDFYRQLGWVEYPGTEEVIFFQVGSLVLALWDRAYLAADSAVDDSGGWGGVTLAYNTRTRQEVDEVIDQDHIREAEDARRAQGDQVGRAGACANQIDLGTACAHVTHPAANEPLATLVATCVPTSAGKC